MNDKHIKRIAEELSLEEEQVRAVAGLLAEGATVPFIARYRKEVTNSLDELKVTFIRDRLSQLAELDKRKESIIKSLTERDILTDELNSQVLGAETLTELEDIYLPYRPKKRTYAQIAREKGLEPLALQLLDNDIDPPIDPQKEAETFIDEEKGVANIEEALAGARDIIAEMVNEDKETREAMRRLYMKKAMIISSVNKGKEQEGAKYRDYFEWQEPAARAPSHRVLAMLRGDKEKAISVRIMPEEDEAIELLNKKYILQKNKASEQVSFALSDSYKRLLAPSMETEIRKILKEQADMEAIRVFSENLRELLLASPLGPKTVLALDPGFRTGCKLVCLDRQGKLLHNCAIYPHTGGKGVAEAKTTLEELVKKFEIEAIAIGNGTASRETESFVKSADISKDIPVIMVNESGASIYSASEAAREEFPDHDITVRGAVSIGRRLQDPLAELVKIDAKSIGVGQYQHDVDQKNLKLALDDAVVSCVNAVGVDVNTASKQLLTYVSGLGPQLAVNIVKYRDEEGRIDSRSRLKKVPRLGPKAFEQAAGFLRVVDGKEPLDKSAVHPESYRIVKKMAKDMKCSVSGLMEDKKLQNNIELTQYADEKIGLPTLFDIMDELAKPGRDPREEFEVVSFAEGVEKIEDVKKGMLLPGIVTNVTRFGAFVDIGVHQDGLVHISQLADRFVKDPAEIVKVNQKVDVTVMDVDIDRKRISLSMKEDMKNQGKSPSSD
jgi:protein Tex